MKRLIFLAPRTLLTLRNTITQGPYKTNIGKYVSTLGVVFSELMS